MAAKKKRTRVKAPVKSPPVETTPETQAEPTQEEQTNDSGKCASCESCDVKNYGFCNNPDARAQLDMWNGVVFLVHKFGCIFHKPRPTKGG